MQRKRLGCQIEILQFTRETGIQHKMYFTSIHFYHFITLYVMYLVVVVIVCAIIMSKLTQRSIDGEKINMLNQKRPMQTLM